MNDLTSGTTDRLAATVGAGGSFVGDLYYAVRYGDQPSETVVVALPKVCEDWVNMERSGDTSMLKEGAMLACRERLAESAAAGTLMTEPSEAG